MEYTVICKKGEYDVGHKIVKMAFKLTKEALEKLDNAMEKIASQVLDKKELAYAMASKCPCGGNCEGSCTGTCTSGCSGFLTVG